ncbi:polymorphic toxin type 15 domain-containing protein [Pseudomonas syringae pv. syringae]|uniref:DUF6861 domain-containing protein n=1 Tax=Pseudomonas TaxID=286 RepID=UPI0006B8C8D8|nr:polymorphic toxin type 15 domain-containing protein [Pseudomonas syringae]AVB24291.1 hypothetical protein BKC06_003740 [Pseudomonas syringae pv. syringae]KPB21440.1 Uncharacterized protein AC518_4034 [Pseudomonas syringae pv. syringae]KWS09362.1 hypothetical protein AL063_18345 [Pseudomonas syringae pv. syringae]MCF5183593.1 hypothetical protein [Pseudomonas syringae]MCF5315691.1 hypothetical protein [Pseudomonas syringae]
MSLWTKIPSWLDIEAYAERLFRKGDLGVRERGMNPLSPPSSINILSIDLIYRRVRCVRQACDLGEKEATNSILKRFSDLDIRSIIDEMISTVVDMAMIIIGSALTGATIGGGVGLLAGGVGAFPGATAGALIGVQAGTWILGVLGLASIAEFFTEGLKPIATGYIRGVSTAWNGPRERTGNPLSSFSDDTMSAQQGAWDIARSHEAVVILLLSAIVAYLTRGRGNLSVLATEMRGSERGAKLGQWMLKHEDALKKHPDLQTAEPRRGALGPQEPPPNSPSAKDKEPPKGKPNTMPRHEVECFKADKMPASKVGEFERQLKGQEDGLNRLTVEEYLKNIANPVKRDAMAAKKARTDLKDTLQERFQREFQKEMSPLDAEEAAIKKARETMASLAGLHNPDLTAGGKDIIADFGDRQVNSSIGPQWRPKIQNLKAAAEKVPETVRDSTFLNVKLHKC